MHLSALQTAGNSALRRIRQQTIGFCLLIVAAPIAGHYASPSVTVAIRAAAVDLPAHRGRTATSLSARTQYALHSFRYQAIDAHNLAIKPARTTPFGSDGIL